MAPIPSSVGFMGRVLRSLIWEFVNKGVMTISSAYKWLAYETTQDVGGWNGSVNEIQLVRFKAENVALIKQKVNS